MTRMDPRMAARRRRVQESHARRSLHRLMRVLIVLALVAAVVWAFRSPLLSVQTVTVRGAHTVDVRTVLAAEGVSEGVPMMDVDADRATAALLDDPWVSEASVMRDWPQTVTVEISERTPVAWVGVADGWVQVAADGVAVVRADGPEVDGPVLVVPDRESADLPSDRDIVGVLQFVTSLPDELAVDARIESSDEGFVGTIGGYPVRLGSGEDGREKALALAAVIATSPAEGSVITVIAPGQPAVLPPGAAEEAADESGEPGDDEADEGTNPEGG